MRHSEATVTHSKFILIEHKVPVASVRCERAHAQIRVQSSHRRHLVVRQPEVEDGDVLCNAFGTHRLWNRHGVVLDLGGVTIYKCLEMIKRRALTIKRRQICADVLPYFWPMASTSGSLSAVCWPAAMRCGRVSGPYAVSTMSCRAWNSRSLGSARFGEHST